MTKFEGTFSGRTTGGFGGVTISTGGVVALIAAGYALTHPRQATAAVTGAATIAAITIGVLVVLAATVVFLRLRGRSRNTGAAQSSQPVSLMRSNPNASELPPRQARAIAAAPIVNVNIGADLLAGLMEAARQQPVPAYVVTAEHVEPQQEIRP